MAARVCAEVRNGGKELVIGSPSGTENRLGVMLLLLLPVPVLPPPELASSPEVAVAASASVSTSLASEETSEITGGGCKGRGGRGPADDNV